MTIKYQNGSNSRTSGIWLRVHRRLRFKLSLTMMTFWRSTRLRLLNSITSFLKNWAISTRLWWSVIRCLRWTWIALALCAADWNIKTLFVCEDDHWRFVDELKGIPNQGIINRRLNRVVLKNNEITFVYNSRVRVYDLRDGILIKNQAVRNARKFAYDGMDVSSWFVLRK